MIGPKIALSLLIAITISSDQLSRVASFLMIPEARVGHNTLSLSNISKGSHESRKSKHNGDDVKDKDIEIPILYESVNLIVINKPPNIPHHSSESEEGILSRIRYLQAKDDSSFPYNGRIFGVHRLDRVTSGILLLAKNSETAAALSKQFRYVSTSNDKIGNSPPHHQS